MSESEPKFWLFTREHLDNPALQISLSVVSLGVIKSGAETNSRCSLHNVLMTSVRNCCTAEAENAPLTQSIVAHPVQASSTLKWAGLRKFFAFQRAPASHYWTRAHYGERRPYCAVAPRRPDRVRRSDSTTRWQSAHEHLAVLYLVPIERAA